MDTKRLSECFQTMSSQASMEELLSSEDHDQNDARDEQADEPPEPGDAMRQGFFGPEFFFDEILVIEVLVRQVEGFAGGGIRPTGFLAGAAFGAGFCAGRNVGAAIGAEFRRSHGARVVLIYAATDWVSPCRRILRPSSGPGP